LVEKEMAQKKNNVQWIIALGAIALFAVLAYSTFQQTRVRYEVCQVFKGSTHCAIAAGSSYDQAVRSAQEIDCQMLSNGRDENMVCLGNPPSSVRPVK
jgi:hypothetical protein